MDYLQPNHAKYKINKIIIKKLNIISLQRILGLSRTLRNSRFFKCNATIIFYFRRGIRR